VTVQQLKEALSYYKNDDEVILAGDAEGNSFYRVDELTREAGIDISYSDDFWDGVVLWPVS
jgi:hypothetical protein